MSSVLPPSRVTRLHPATFRQGVRAFTPEAVPIPRLFEILDRALGKPVIWLHGPPGSGKTTLVTAYHAARGTHPIWCRLDADDSQAASFLHSLSMAIRRGGRDGALESPPLGAETLGDAKVLSREFFRRFFDSVDPPPIVIDDYQEIEPGSETQACLAEALKQITAGAKVFVISRTPPPDDLARFRINGLVEVVGPSVLRLDAAEAEAFARHRRLEIEAAEIDRLVTRTHGWAAGLTLIMDEIKTAGCSFEAAADEVAEVLNGYFASEVFDRLSGPDGCLLLKLSFLPSVSSRSALTLTDDAGAELLLRKLARRHCFIESEGGSEPIYRFNPLFHDFLRARARTAFGSDRISLLQARAARALEECGEIEAAVSILCECRGFDDLARIILLNSTRLIEDGRYGTLASWIDKLPKDRIAADGWLSFWAATATAASQRSASRAMFGQALMHFERSGDIKGVFLAWAGLAEAINQDMFADRFELDGDIEQLRTLIYRYPSFPSDEIAFRVSLSMFVALAQRSNNRDEIVAWRERAYAAARRLGRSELGDLIRCFQITFHLNDGEFLLAQPLLEVLPAPESLDEASGLQLAAYIAKAYAQVSCQASGLCAETAEAAISLSQGSSLSGWAPLLACFAATDAFQRRDLVQGRLWLRRAAQLSYQCTGKRDADHLGAPYHVAACNLALLEGDVFAALACGRTAVDIARHCGWLRYEALARLSLSQALDNAGELEAADEQLALAQAVLDRSATAALEFGIRLLKADYLLERGCDGEGRALLAEAMALGERTGARRTCLTPLRTSRLLAFALSEAIAPEYARLLVRAGGLAPTRKRVEQWPWLLKIKAFGGFEVWVDREPLVFPRKAPRQLLRLLKAIVVFGSKDVQIPRIIDTIWPEEDGDAGNRSFDVAIHRLRKMLGDSRVILVRDGRVTLDPDRAWIDVFEFEKGITAPDAAEREQALRLYTGELLAGHDDLSWVEPRRQQLQRLHARALQSSCKEQGRLALT